MPSPSPQLLLDCLKSTDPQAKDPQLSRYSPSDWHAIFESARLHALSPLLYFRLHNLGWTEKLPTEVATKLRKAILIIARNNLLKFEQLGPVLQVLNAAGIPAIPLKGAHLAAWVYPDPALRPMGDIDLLVHRRDLAAAHAVLKDIGYNASRSFDIDDECSRMQHLPPLGRPSGITSLELHWTIAPPASPFATDIASTWARAHPASFAGIPAYALAAEDLLLHLVLHTSYQHSYGLGLLPFMDLHTLLQSAGDALAWDALIQRSRLWGLDRSLFLTTLTLNELLGPPPQQEHILALQPPGYQPWMLAAVVNLVTSGRPELTINLAELLDDAAPPEKVARFFRRIFPEPAVMRREYNLDGNGGWLPYYYLVRLASLTRRNTHSVLQLLHRDPQTLVASKLQNQVVQVREWLEPTA